MGFWDHVEKGVKILDENRREFERTAPERERLLEKSRRKYDSYSVEELKKEQGRQFKAGHKDVAYAISQLLNERGDD